MQKALEQINSTIFEACRKSGRTASDVTIVAVSKTHSPEKIRQAYSFGVHDFGENYMQEAQGKLRDLKDLSIHWHFIGRLQRKKIKSLVGEFEYFHAVDRIELLEEINKWAQQKLIKQKCLIQVNLSEEESKGGVGLASVSLLFERAKSLYGVEIVGLTTMPPWPETEEDNRLYFSRLRQLKEELTKGFPEFNLQHLSMGTSGDFRVAIEEGATFVRIGTALLGERNYNDQEGN